MMWLGITVLAAFFAVLFIATAKVEGVKVAAAIWGIALLGTGIIALGACLATGAIG